MRRSTQASPGPDLFDLPLLVDAEPRAEIEPTAEAEQIELPPEDPAVERDLDRERWISGALDLALAAAAPLLALLGAALLGVRPALAQLPAYLLIALQVSFIYSIFCLVFWSRTLGMKRAGLIARAADGGPLTFGQAARRWLGSAATVALLGIPAIASLRGGRSLADRLSGTDIEQR